MAETQIKSNAAVTMISVTLAFRDTRTTENRNIKLNCCKTNKAFFSPLFLRVAFDAVVVVVRAKIFFFRASEGSEDCDFM